MYKDLIKMGMIKNQLIEQSTTEITIQEIEDINEEDFETKLNAITDEERHQAIADNRCCLCGSKLHHSCYAEDSYAVECVNCDIMYAE